MNVFVSLKLFSKQMVTCQQTNYIEVYAYVTKEQISIKLFRRCSLKFIRPATVRSERHCHVISVTLISAVRNGPIAVVR